MDDISPLPLAADGWGLEQTGRKVTIRGAKQALELARSKGQAEEVAAALIWLAHLHFRQGRYAQTRALAGEVLCDAPTDSLARCDALRMLGNCAAEQGDPQGAEEYYHQAVDLARQLDYRYGLYKCLHSLATNIYWPRGQFDLCLAAGKEAVAQAEALHLGEELWFPLSDIAWVYWSTAQYGLAGQVADRMASVVCPASLGEGFTLCLRAGLEKPGDGYLETVLPLYDRARSIAETTGDPGLHVEVRLGLCRAYRGVRDLPAAAAWAEDAVAVTLRLNYRQFQSVALIERARTALDLGDHRAARADLEAAIEIALPLRANFDLARAFLYLALLEEKPGPILLEALRRIQTGGYVFLLDEEREISYPLLASGLAAKNTEIREYTALFLKELQSMPARPLTIQTLGGLQVYVGKYKIEKKVLGQRRADELLVLLLLASDYSLTYEQISEALWPDRDPDNTRSHFHQACSRLRHALEPELNAQDLPSRYLFIENGRVSLHLPAGSRVDVHDFYSLCKQEEWDQALIMMRGDLLPEYPYAEWLFIERQRIAPLYQRALFLNAQSSVKAGRYASGLDFVRRLLSLEPWHEDAVLLGMQASMALEDKTGARRLYKQLEKTLAEELNAQPHADLTAYFQLINQRKK